MNEHTGLWPALKQSFTKSLRRSLWLPAWMNDGNGKEHLSTSPRRAGKSLHPFDLDYPLLMWSPVDSFRLRDAVTNVLTFGATGSGKTSGVLRTLLQAYLRAGYGGLILTTKPGDYDEVRQWAKETGRLDDLIRFAPDEKHRFSFLTYESRRPGRGSGQTESLVKLFTTLSESIERGGGESTGKHDDFSNRRCSSYSVTASMSCSWQDRMSHSPSGGSMT